METFGTVVSASASPELYARIAAAEPPADAASGEPFVRYCRVGLEARVLRDSIRVTFYAEGSEVVPTDVRIIVHE